MSRSLFEKYNGIAGMTQVVHSFYEDLLDSATLAKFFEGKDMNTLMDHQVKFFSQALGGPANYSGRAMHEAHKRLRISHFEFDEALRILKDNLTENDIEPGDVETIMATVESLRGNIVAQPRDQED